MSVGPYGPSSSSDDAGRVPVVGHPVRLELEQHVDDDRAAEQPVEVGRVELVDEVVEADRAAALEPGDEVDDAERRERVAGLGDDRRAEVGGGHARRSRSQGDGSGRACAVTVDRAAGTSDFRVADLENCGGQDSTGRWPDYGPRRTLRR